MPVVNLPRMDIETVNGQKVISPWEFLSDHPRAMESGYFYVNWNNIPRLYNQKSYLRTLVIEKEEWDHLSDPAQLKHYWEPTQDLDDFHWTLGLALCWTPFNDCSEPTRKKEYVVSVAVVQNRHGIPDCHLKQLRENSGMTPLPHLYSFGCTGNPCCSRTFTMTSAGLILP